MDDDERDELLRLIERHAHNTAQATMFIAVVVALWIIIGIWLAVSASS